MAIAEQLRRLRQQQGLSLRALAERSGIDAGALSRYEHGIKIPRADTLATLALALGAEVDLRPRRSRNARYVDLLCRLQAQALADDPGLLELARAQLHRLEGASAQHEVWRRLLDAGPLAVIGALTSSSPELDAVKADSPLAFVVAVSDEQRRELAEASRAA